MGIVRFILKFGLPLLLIFLLVQAVNIELGKVKGENVEVKAIDFDSGGFTLEGNISINNPSIIPLTLKGIEYDVETREGEKVFHGTVGEAKIKSKEIKVMEISERVEWDPQENETAILNGTANLRALYLYNLKIPFSREFVVKE